MTNARPSNILQNGGQITNEVLAPNHHKIWFEDDLIRYLVGGKKATVKARSAADLERLINAGNNCLVCGSPSDAFHYGTRSCLSCSDFFKKSILDCPQYICVTGGKCRVNHENLMSVCSACRMRKCVFNGMNLSAVLAERVTDNRDLSEPPPDFMTTESADNNSTSTVVSASDKQDAISANTSTLFTSTASNLDIKEQLPSTSTAPKFATNASSPTSTASSSDASTIFTTTAEISEAALRIATSKMRKRIRTADEKALMMGRNSRNNVAQDVQQLANTLIGVGNVLVSQIDKLVTGKLEASHDLLQRLDELENQASSSKSPDKKKKLAEFLRENESAQDTLFVTYTTSKSVLDVELVARLFGNVIANGVALSFNEDVAKTVNRDNYTVISTLSVVNDASTLSTPDLPPVNLSTLAGTEAPAKNNDSASISSLPTVRNASKIDRHHQQRKNDVTSSTSFLSFANSFPIPKKNPTNHREHPMGKTNTLKTYLKTYSKQITEDDENDFEDDSSGRHNGIGEKRKIDDSNEHDEGRSPSKKSKKKARRIDNSDEDAVGEVFAAEAKRLRLERIYEKQERKRLRTEKRKSEQLGNQCAATEQIQQENNREHRNEQNGQEGAKGTTRNEINTLFTDKQKQRNERNELATSKEKRKENVKPLEKERYTTAAGSSSNYASKSFTGIVKEKSAIASFLGFRTAENTATSFFHPSMNKKKNKEKHRKEEEKKRQKFGSRENPKEMKDLLGVSVKDLLKKHGFPSKVIVGLHKWDRNSMIDRVKNIIDSSLPPTSAPIITIITAPSATAMEMDTGFATLENSTSAAEKSTMREKSGERYNIDVNSITALKMTLNSSKTPDRVTSAFAPNYEKNFLFLSSNELSPLRKRKAVSEQPSPRLVDRCEFEIASAQLANASNNFSL